MSQAHLLVDPDWPCMRIDAAELCANDWEAPIFISCWDWDLGDSDDEIGRVVVTMEDLQQAADEKAEIPLEPADDKERNVGFLIVNRLEIEMVPPERDIDKENQMPDPVEERMKMDRKTSWAQKFLDKLAGKDKQKASLLGVQTVLVWPTFVFFAVIMTSVAMLWLAEMLLWGTALDPSNRGGSSIIFEAELCGECHACSRVSSNMDDRLTPLIPAESLEALQIVLEDTCVQTSECETFCVRVELNKARYFSIIWLTTGIISYLSSFVAIMFVIGQTGYRIEHILYHVTHARESFEDMKRKFEKDAKEQYEAELKATAAKAE
mmetsp:Transcript_25265/g.59589  ORF Transcript_25265/g.59589 Transcript_25265/m.59589 type:complete len:322 (+) Transcript_25265:934-1899(+)